MKKRGKDERKEKQIERKMRRKNEKMKENERIELKGKIGKKIKERTDNNKRNIG